MEKRVLLKKIKYKILKNKNQKYKEYFLKNLSMYNFLKQIVNIDNDEFKNIEKNINLILKENKDYENLYKKFRFEITRFLNIVNVENFTVCQDKFLREYQLKTLEHAKFVINFFDKNNLEYFITSGSLLGALRHKGFIPWDDDIDVGMMRKDYERLKVLLKKNFYCVDIDKVYASKNNKNKIIDKALKKTKNQIVYYIGHRYIQIIQGKNIKDAVFLDIFPHEYYATSFSVTNYKKLVSRMRVKNDEEDSIKNKLKDVLEEINNNPNIVETSNSIYFALDSLDSYLFTPENFIPKNVIFPLSKIKFEGVEFYAPNKPIDYIKFQYKNYMSLPTFIEIAPDLTERLGKKIY